jgi:hypothetical protein
VVPLAADNLKDFILPDPFYRSVKFDYLTRFEIPGIAFLRRCPAQGTSCTSRYPFAEISRLLTGATNRARNSVNFPVCRTHDKRRPGLAASVSECLRFHVRRCGHLGTFSRRDLSDGANLV